MEETACEVYVYLSITLFDAVSLTLGVCPVHKDGVKKSKNKKESGSNLFV